MLGIILRALPHLIFATVLNIRYYYNLHVTGEASEA